MSQLDNALLHANLDQDLNLSGRFHYTWPVKIIETKDISVVSETAEPPKQMLPSILPPPSVKSKIETQFTAQQNMVSFEHEIIAQKYSMSFRAINPSFWDLPKRGDVTQKATKTGIFSASFIHGKLTRYP